MTSRPLVRSIPFWVLFIGSLALTGYGAWMVVDRLAGFENSVLEGAADQAAQLDLTISTYTIGPAATAGAVILGAGIVGLLLTATVAAIASVLPRPGVEVLEPLDDEVADDSDLAVLHSVATTASVEPAVTATTVRDDAPAAPADTVGDADAPAAPADTVRDADAPAAPADATLDADAPAVDDGRDADDEKVTITR